MIDSYHFIVGMLLSFLLGFTTCYCILGWILIKTFRGKK